jgi:hypothetical protein
MRLAFEEPLDLHAILMPLLVNPKPKKTVTIVVAATLEVLTM